MANNQIWPHSAYDISKGDAISIRIGRRAVVCAGVNKADGTHVALFVNRPDRIIDDNRIAMVKAAVKIDVPIGKTYMHIIAGGRCIASKKNGMARIDGAQVCERAICDIAQPKGITVSAFAFVMCASHRNISDDSIHRPAKNHTVRPRFYDVDIGQMRAD